MNRRLRTLIVLAIALVCATLASVAMFLAVKKLPRGTKQEETVPVIVATQQVSVGDVLTEKDVKVVQWPLRTKVPGSYSDTAKVVGHGLKATVVAGQPLTDQVVASGPDYGLQLLIRDGKRAISVRVNEVIGVAGFILPGMRVDVVATIRQSSDSVSRIVVSDVQVLTAGTLIDEEKAKKDGKPVSTTVVTLMVTPDQAQRIALAATEGQILLTLRHPLDKDVTRPPAVRTAGLMAESDVAKRTLLVQKRTAPVVPAKVIKWVNGKPVEQEVIR